jgi:hypothetical protein
MRSVLLAAFMLLYAGAAGAQPCAGCGCNGGSGWRIVTTNSKKCIGCGEVASRCGTSPTERCVFEGCSNIATIRINCPLHIPAKACSLK